MRLSAPLLRLPIDFSPQALAEEVKALPASAWTPHPEGFPGNDAVLLVTPNGELTEAFEGPMAATRYLRQCPYIMALMARLGGVWGRSRLMGLGAGAEVKAHVDVHYYWRTHLRIHIPVITNSQVEFTCGDQSVHMGAGECWVFDSFQRHDVQNRGSERRVHLVLDTTGGEELWELVEAASNGGTATSGPWMPASLPKGDDALVYERVNVPKIMSPWEISCHVDYILEHALPHPALGSIGKTLERFVASWQATWSRFETSDEGLPAYRCLIDRIQKEVADAGGYQIRLRNGQTLAYAVDALVLWNAVNRNLLSPNAGQPISPKQPEPFRDRLERPIFIVSTPRSGSTLLFETLMQTPDLFTPGEESHALIESVPGLSVPSRNWSTNRLDANDAAPEVVEQLARSFYRALRDRDGRRPEGRVRMLEKTPKNALRVPFFDAAWPDADFIFLYRDPRQTLASMLEAWLSGRFRTYPTLPGWEGYPWSMLLVPGWENLKEMKLPQIIAHQWATTMGMLVEDLSMLPANRVMSITYDDLVASPQATIERLVGLLDLNWDRRLQGPLPLSKTTVSPPSPSKWRGIEHVLTEVWPIVERADARARDFLERTIQNPVPA